MSVSVDHLERYFLILLILYKTPSGVSVECIGLWIASQGQDEWQIEQSQQTSMISQEDWAKKSRYNFGTSSNWLLLNVKSLFINNVLHLAVQNNYNYHTLSHAWTKPNSDIYNTQHSQQTCALKVQFKSCGSRTIKGERTLYIELQN